MKLTISEIVALVLGSMLGLRMMLSLIKPKNHRSVAINLYNKKAVIPKRILRDRFPLVQFSSDQRYIDRIFRISWICHWCNLGFLQHLVPVARDVGNRGIIRCGKPIPLYLSPRPKKNIIQALVIIGMVIWMYVDIFSKY